MLRKSGVSRNVTEELCQDLSEVPWFVMDSFDPTDEMWGYWKSLFLSVTEDHAPFAKVTVRQESLSWITVEVRRLMRTIL